MIGGGSISFRVLGSGSRGNATLVRFTVEACPASAGVPATRAAAATLANATPSGPVPARHVLIDAGFSPRRLGAALGEEGLEPADLDAIVITHADHDHFHPGWARVVERHEVPVFAHRRHRGRLVHHGVTGRTLQLFDGDAFSPFRATRASGAGRDADEHHPERAPRFHPVMCVHDDTGSAAFVIEHGGCRLGWATDLGRVPPRLLEQFRDLDAVAIESNYDPVRQRESGRPPFLTQRITGGTGHLANEQALEAVMSIDAASRPGLARVVLLHLSRDCNCPDLVRELWTRRAPRLAARLVLSRQDAAAPWIDLAPIRTRAVQGSLFA